MCAALWFYISRVIEKLALHYVTHCHISCYFAHQFSIRKQMSQHFAIVCNIDAHTAMYHTCYVTWFILLFLWSPRSLQGRQANNFPRRVHLLLTRTMTNYRVRWPRFCPGSCNDAGANLHGSSTHGCKLFNHSISHTRTRMRGCEYACVRRLAWLCHDSSLQFVRWSKATAGVREHYRR